MLKVRISASKAELEKIVSSIEDGVIKKFKHLGSVTYAIDTSISVSDFLAKHQKLETSKHLTSEEKLKTIHHDLTDLLDVMKDD